MDEDEDLITFFFADEDFFEYIINFSTYQLRDKKNLINLKS
jgi:hypothetical protein